MCIRDSVSNKILSFWEDKFDKNIKKHIQFLKKKNFFEANYELMNLFNLLKPVNSDTGRKNPTVINSSWGYNAAITASSTVNYKFAGDTGSFTGNDGFDTSTTSANLVKAMKEGFGNGYDGSHRSWC